MYGIREKYYRGNEYFFRKEVVCRQAGYIITNASAEKGGKVNPEREGK